MRSSQGWGSGSISWRCLSPEGGFGVPRAVSLVSEHTRSPVALPAQVVVVADCLSSSWLHLGFDPQSWIKQKKKQTQKPQHPCPKQTENTKQSEEPDLRRRQEGWAWQGPMSQIPLPCLLGMGPGCAPHPAWGSPEQPLPPPVAAK